MGHSLHPANNHVAILKGVIQNLIPFGLDVADSPAGILGTDGNTQLNAQSATINTAITSAADTLNRITRVNAIKGALLNASNVASAVLTDNINLCYSGVDSDYMINLYERVLQTNGNDIPPNQISEVLTHNEKKEIYKTANWMRLFDTTGTHDH